MLQAVDPTLAIDLFIAGIPRPQGSKSASLLMKNGELVLDENGRPIIVMFDASKHLRRWRKHCRAEARKQYSGEPLAGAVHCEMDFNFPRPGKHYARGGLARNAPTFHTQKPDLTKIVRAVEDALTGIVWRDDAEVVQGRNRKGWTHSDPGVRVRVIPLTHKQQEATLW